MQPAPDPVFLNVEYLFLWIYNHTIGFFRFILSGDFFFLLRIIAVIVAILLITLILYCLVRFYELHEEDNKKDRAKTKAATPEVGPQAVPVASGASGIGRNDTWENIRAKLLSDNQSDWRLAIIEADIYLDRLLETKGYTGDTIGDKLKQITPEVLGSIQIAWEAHKVRNRIAHEGADFTLTQPEARRVLSYYEIVFRDLGAIA